ncbi:helix-turn-helix domain-containing protein [Pseudomonas cremoricolorata]|uniref:helix-turn-helix domain-containing protein n=1 Tax=Pseudomonas cremoricolorata TaxID=157783 RepID=UPI00067658DA|nr:helix-turn-helix domain-containing protein [Pseudomonas cremoricolorata]
MDTTQRLQEPAQLAAYGEKIVNSGVLGKSRRMIRLFEFLLERSISGTATKEIEIAQVVFGRTTDVDLTADATVRVHIHRLRKKLAGVPVDEHGQRLMLPRGDYRLVLASGDTPSTDELPLPQHWRRWRFAAGAALLLALNGAGWALWGGQGPQDTRTQSRLWQGVASGSAPVLVVSGDFYVFGEQNASGAITRMVADESITSSAALEHYKQRMPNLSQRYVDMNTYHLPSGLASALVAVAPVASATRPRQPNLVSNVTTSRFTNEMLSNHDIVYVGLLDSLGDLKEPFFDLSGFTLTANGAALIDKASGERFESDWDEPSTERIMRHDYAYLARFPGPAGNHIVVVAGIMDPALVEAAKLASSAVELGRLQAAVGDSAAFEALYEVRTFGPSNVAAERLIARPLEVGTLWRSRKAGVAQVVAAPGAATK